MPSNCQLAFANLPGARCESVLCPPEILELLRDPLQSIA